MKRKDFLKKGIVGLGTIVAIPTVISACSDDDDLITGDDTSGGTDGGNSGGGSTGDCTVSPSETAGPFPIKTPAELVRDNIVGDRTGVALLITLTIQDESLDCSALEGAYVDLWQCDKDGFYSQYGGTNMQPEDFTGYNFLRGRATTDANGQVSFVSIFPGWYMSRAPHIHLEILDSNENSLLVTQIAFPKDVCDTVYASEGYNGEQDTLNENDNVFSDSVDGNMLDSITGDIVNGYTLLKTIVV